MKRSSQIFAYAFLTIVGIFLFSFIYDGNMIRISIASDSTQSLIGIILIAVGAVALGGTIHSQQVAHKRIHS
ncbi:MAG TPA: hypothetical protein VFW07_27780 [Parafilimonas sp.]|nr:hypothetical protein [Parafilimonas sp.]